MNRNNVKILVLILLNRYIYSPWICAYGWDCKVTAKCVSVRFEEMPLNSFPRRFNQLHASQQCIQWFSCFPSFLTVGIFKSLLNFIITGVGHACLGGVCGDQRTSLSVISLYLSIGPRDWIQVIKLAWLYRKMFLMFLPMESSWQSNSWYFDVRHFNVFSMCGNGGTHLEFQHLGGRGRWVWGHPDLQREF